MVEVCAASVATSSARMTAVARCGAAIPERLRISMISVPRFWNRLSASALAVAPTETIAVTAATPSAKPINASAVR